MSTSLSVRETRAQLVHATALRQPNVRTVEDLRAHHAGWNPEIFEQAVADLVDAGLLSEDAHGHLIAEGAA